jgi:hypothetical protein
MNKFGYFGLKFYSIFRELGIELKTFSLKNKIFNFLEKIYNKQEIFMGKEIDKFIDLFPDIDTINEVLKKRLFEKIVKK